MSTSKSNKKAAPKKNAAKKSTKKTTKKPEILPVIENKQTQQVLDTRELKAADIECKINQNDIVEIVAEKLYQKAVSEVERLNNMYNELLKSHFTKSHNDDFYKFITSISKTEILKRDSYGTFYEKSSYEYQNISFLKIDNYRSKDAVNRINRGINTMTKPGKITYQTAIQDSTVKNGKDTKITSTIINTYEKTYLVSKEEINDFESKRKQYEEEVNKFLNSLPKDYWIDPSYFAKQARIKINSKLLQGNSNVLTQKLEDFFDIKLT